MKKTSILTFSAAILVSFAACIGGLPSLKSSFVIGEHDVPGVGVQKAFAPYSETVNYWGYIKPGQAADAVVNGKKSYFLYVWVPAAIAELGVRLISPTGEIGDPSSEDFQSDAFKAATPEEKSMPNWFDTWIRVERLAAIMPNQIEGAAKGKALQNLGDNDDGDDTYNEERHAKYNSLLRITIPNLPKSLDELKNLDTKKLLVRGLYRITFTTYKVGEVKGSFVATVGVLGPPGVPGLSPILHANPAELQKQATAAEEALKKAVAGDKK
ncbi:major surface lipoprotein LipL32 [Leptospira wolffii]|uniref:Major surface lipoprotein LipL32 n=1 Tax=Leptospira wolffii TaxID=409998 RepID=A0A2M9ZD48_9LEPT|nr:major surface lipoprotein LipL32 [Leptospira wolffii]EPG67801.1 spirochaetales surface lipoprotein [Leptospira wolffii serovar Khorat str. Khorat-H2]PJZ66304.1 outer membrane surface lipoprotein LipL32 [Leptospira wolffii]TGL46540.1 outer membrane surface lipoprotein LipL32 [Leptospira wolffii]